MKTLAEIQESYLEIIQAELSGFGADPQQVKLNAQGQLEVEDHDVDMVALREETSTNFPWDLRLYTTDRGYLVFMPNQTHYEALRASEELESELDRISKLVRSKIEELESLYYGEIRSLSEDKTLAERVSEGIRHNLSITDNLSDVSSWKAKVIIGNSRGPDSPKVGEMDSVGYVHIGINTGSIVPVASSDEHHRGYDLIGYLQDQGLIPQDTYFPLFFRGDYVDGFDPVALEAMRTWRKLGGPNILIKNSSRGYNSIPFQLTIDDYLKAEGKIEVPKGELLPVGKEFIQRLQELSSACQNFRSTGRGEKVVYTTTLRLLRFYQEKVTQYATKSLEEIMVKVSSAEKLGGPEGLQKLEEAIFGFDGLKNQIHQQVRVAMDPKAFSFKRDDMLGIFGDLDLANHELGKI